MTSRHLTSSSFRKLLLCTATGLQLVMTSGTSFAGDESPDPARFGELSHGLHTLSASRGLAEYAVTGSGAIVPLHIAGPPSAPKSGSDNFDNFSNHAPSLIGSSEFDQKDNLPDNRPMLAYSPDGGISPLECGPSPLTPEAIRGLTAQAAARHGVAQSLAEAVVAVESGFDRDRNSPKGARGPMQLMPATAERFGVSDPCEPEANIDAGVRYLGVLLEEFGNPLLAVAAYNAGEARIYQYGGIPPFPETVSYVAKVINHQLGLPAPRKTPNAKAGSEPPAERGVVASTKRRQWVAGVMQF